MIMMMIRAQLRIKLENCVCGEASAPIGLMMQIISMRGELKYYLNTCVLVEPVGCMFIISTLYD